MNTNEVLYNNFIKNLKGFSPEMPGERFFCSDVISTLSPRTKDHDRAILVAGIVRTLRIAAILLVSLLVVQQFTDYRNRQLATKQKMIWVYTDEKILESGFSELSDSLVYPEVVKNLSVKELHSLSVRYSRIKAENQPKIRQMATVGQVL